MLMIARTLLIFTECELPLTSANLKCSTESIELAVLGEGAKYDLLDFLA